MLDRYVRSIEGQNFITETHNQTFEAKYHIRSKHQSIRVSTECLRCAYRMQRRNYWGYKEVQAVLH